MMELALEWSAGILPARISHHRGKENTVKTSDTDLVPFIIHKLVLNTFRFPLSVFR